MTDSNLIDRRHAQLAVFRDAEKEYEANTGERVAHWQRRLLARYTRNLALAGNDLSAGIFDLTVAARGIADDNYACAAACPIPSRNCALMDSSRARRRSSLANGPAS